jgi:hypothetical protein
MLNLKQIDSIMKTENREPFYWEKKTVDLILRIRKEDALLFYHLKNILFFCTN